MGKSSVATGLALWVGRKAKGTARLSWGPHELTLHVAALQIVGVEGDDRERLSAAFGLTTGREWFQAAQEAVAAGQVTQAEANAVVKRAIAEQLHDFFTADDAQVEYGGEFTQAVDGLRISYPHLVVETVLGTGGDDLVGVFLPDANRILRRLPDFARRVGALGLTEEAMAVLAKINDQRTALEIAAPSPHGRQTALRLLAAAVGAGLAETTERITEVPLAGLSTPVGREDVPARRRGLWFLVIALVMLAAAAVAYFAWSSTGSKAAGSGGPWSIAVDGGCQPAETERLYRSQERNAGTLRVVPFGTGEEKCKRLVWGRFASKVEAERAIGQLPEGIVARGFAPHVVLVDNTSP